VELRPQRLLRELSGRADREFVELLCAQIDTALRAARLVREVVAEGREHDFRLRERIGELESEGDAQRADIVTALSGALVTPIDREDIYRLSRGIDDVLDNLRDFSREWDIYGMASHEIFGPLLEEVTAALRALRVAAEHIVSDPSGIARGALEAKKAGNLVRRSYQLAIAEMLEDDERVMTARTVKARELLRRLDIVGMRVSQAADVLADAAVKRSH
jgi:uncharacterized protein